MYSNEYVEKAKKYSKKDYIEFVQENPLLVAKLRLLELSAKLETQEKLEGKWFKQNSFGGVDNFYRIIKSSQTRNFMIKISKYGFDYPEAQTEALEKLEIVEFVEVLASIKKLRDILDVVEKEQWETLKKMAGL
jgi:hypothetical protein